MIRFRALFGLFVAYVLAAQVVLSGFGTVVQAASDPQGMPVWCRPGALLDDGAGGGPAQSSHDLCCAFACASGSAPALAPPGTPSLPVLQVAGLSTPPAPLAEAPRAERIRLRPAPRAPPVLV